MPSVRKKYWIACFPMKWIHHSTNPPECDSSSMIDEDHCEKLLSDHLICFGLFRYQGLDDFRGANWEAGENLPKDYAKIYQFSNVKLSKKSALDVSERIVVVRGFFCFLLSSPVGVIF
jgi:hypothetical protein